MWYKYKYKQNVEISVKTVGRHQAEHILCTLSEVALNQSEDKSQY